MRGMPMIAAGCPYLAGCHPHHVTHPAPDIAGACEWLRLMTGGSP